MYYLNPNVETLNRVFDQNKREGYLRLDLNENPSSEADRNKKSFVWKLIPGNTRRGVGK